MASLPFSLPRKTENDNTLFLNLTLTKKFYCIIEISIFWLLIKFGFSRFRIPVKIGHFRLLCLVRMKRKTN